MSAIRDIYPKMLKFSKSSVKIKVISGWIFFVILLTSAFIRKQRIFHGNEIVKFFKSHKLYDVERTILERTYKVLQSS